jgi:hypothetical protein
MTEILLPGTLGVAVGYVGNIIHERFPAINPFNRERTTIRLRGAIALTEAVGMFVSLLNHDPSLSIAFGAALLSTLSSKDTYVPHLGTARTEELRPLGY